jgi:hypothetical protein
MPVLVLKAYLSLIYFDLCLVRGDFAALYREVRNTRLASQIPMSADITGEVCRAVDMASIWYWKQVRCLQRSATTTCLLRNHGVSSQMVIGASQMPFRAHAWVEVNGRVVNDKPYMSEVYPELDRC